MKTIYLHGFLGSARDWEKFPGLALDLPGHGDAPFTPDFCGYLLEAIAKLHDSEKSMILTAFARPHEVGSVDNFSTMPERAGEKLSMQRLVKGRFYEAKSFAIGSLEKTKGPPVHLVGYSMGGRLALQFAQKYPVAKLTVIGAHFGLKAEERAARLEKDRALAKRMLEIPFDQFLKEWYDQPLFRTLCAKMDIRAMRENQNVEGLALALDAFSLGRQEILEILNLPCTRLVGEHDTAYRKLYENVPHIVIPNAGHAAHLENPEAVYEFL